MTEIRRRFGLAKDVFKKVRQLLWNRKICAIMALHKYLPLWLLARFVYLISLLIPFLTTNNSSTLDRLFDSSFCLSSLIHPVSDKFRKPSFVIIFLRSWHFHFISGCILSMTDIGIYLGEEKIKNSSVNNEMSNINSLRWT